MVDDFAEKIDITNSQQVLQYGAASQKKIGDFSEAALAKVSTKDLGEVGEMITDLIGELKSFDAAEEEKGIFGFFKKKSNQLDQLKTKYNKAETNVENIQAMLEGHQVQLLKGHRHAGQDVRAEHGLFQRAVHVYPGGQEKAGAGAGPGAAAGHGQGQTQRPARGRPGGPGPGRSVRAV